MDISRVVSNLLSVCRVRQAYEEESEEGSERAHEAGRFATSFAIEIMTRTVASRTTVCRVCK